ncbi:MAG: hypothetical protein Q7S44_02275 [bacterium]|nr:hypothetical protein [bacterium]
MNMSALKIVFSSWLIVVGLFIFALPAFAFLNFEGTGQQVKASDYDANAHSGYTLQNVACNIDGFLGANFCGPQVAITADPKTGKTILMRYDQLPGGGVIGGLGMIASTFYTNPPTSTTFYLANLGENLGIGPKTAYAQVPGSGNGIISPVLAVWTATRNIAYLFFIAIFLVVGLMIMLRQKINPQTVISVQQALPSLVIGLILVTFSYFIAALLLDTAFVGIQLVAQIFTTGGLSNTSVLGSDQQVRDLAQNANVFGLFGSIGFNLNSLDVVSQGVGGQIGTTFGPWAYIIPLILSAILIVFGPLGWIGAGLVAIGGATLTPVIIPTIIVGVLLIALVIQMFRLLFALLTTYIQILIFTIAGPLYILVGSIPGKGAVIGMWWKGLLGNAMVFPAVFAAFLFAGFILGNANNAAAWNTTVPFFGGVDGNFIRALIAFGIVLGIPSIPEMVRKAFGVSGPQGFAQAALGGFMGGVGVGRAGINKGWQATGMPQQRQAYQEAQAKQVATGAPAGTPTYTTTGWRNRFQRLIVERK